VLHRAIAPHWRIHPEEKGMLSVNEQLPGTARKLFSMNEPFVSAAKTNLDAQLSVLTELSTKAIESIQQVVDLNLNAAKASTEDSAAAARQLLAANDPQEFLSLTVAQAQPAAAKAIAYNLHLAAIAAATQAEIARAAEEQIAETDRKISALVDEVAKSAPAGSENVMAVMKSAIGNASAGYEHFSKTAKQAVEVMETNLNTAANRFSQAAEQRSSTNTGLAPKQ
jgi:phasin family protein